MCRRAAQGWARAWALAAAVAWLSWCAVVRAAPTTATTSTSAPAPAPTAQSSATSISDSKVAPGVLQLRQRHTHLRQLLAGELPADIDPRVFFSVDLNDEPAVAAEIRRLRAVLRDAENNASESAANGRDLTSATPTAQQGDAGTSSTLPIEDGEYWEARVLVDQAQLEFLSLDSARRAELLASHAADRLDAEPDPRASTVREQARNAERRRQQVLQAAIQAKSEALRLLNEEHARLLAVKMQQAEYETDLLGRQEQQKAWLETTLSWRRRINELDATSELYGGRADELYHQLHSALESALDRLQPVLSKLQTSDTRVPTAGDERVHAEGLDLDRSEYRSTRQEVLEKAAELRLQERRVAWADAEVLVEQVESLNRDRLRLLHHLSPELRARVTGISEEGLHQARNELRLVLQVLRFHAISAMAWLERTAQGRSPWGRASVIATLSLIELLFVGAAFVWWRRRADGVLSTIHDWSRKHAAESVLAYRLGGFVSVMRRARKPLEWLVFLGLVYDILGENLQGLLEVRVAWILAKWTLGGATCVLLVDALAERRAAVAKSNSKVSDLRFRSLRLLGRVIVGFGLVLSLSNEFVGPGTLHSWVLRTCWLAAVPLIVLFVGWWKEVIFARLEPRKNRNMVVAWAARHQQGAAGFLAALIGGGYLLGLGAVRLLREYVSGVTLVRRLLAYLFQREISKNADGGLALSSLDAAAFDALDPERDGGVWVHVPEEDQLQQCVRRGLGGVFALVGDRGCGKSTQLARLTHENRRVLHFRCSQFGQDPLTSLYRHFDIPREAGPERLLDRLNTVAEEHWILIDDTHRSVMPMIGGLGPLQQALSLARRANRRLAWVFAFDSNIYQFVERGLGRSPAFDEVVRLKPWSEECIAELLKRRSEAAGFDPDFSLLVRKVVQGDAADFAERLARTREGYYRVLWDYSGGNAAVSLHFWRQSLGQTQRGRVCAGLFGPPSTRDLEQLPDSTCFVLRALLRLDFANEGQLAQATRLDVEQVRNAVHYAMRRQYLTRDNEGQLRVSWQWYRAITLVLQRKHFLSKGIAA